MMKRRQDAQMAIVGLSVGWLIFAAAALAGEDPRSMVPAGGGGNKLDLSMIALDGTRTRSVRNNEKIKVGQRVRICFRATKSGYITLWSHNADGGVSRILPNKYTGKGKAIKVRRGTKYCIAKNGLVAQGKPKAGAKDWWFEVRKPLGRANLYLHWTPKMEQQLPENGFVDIDALGRAVGRALRKNYSAIWFSYTVAPR